MSTMRLSRCWLALGALLTLSPINVCWNTAYAGPGLGMDASGTPGVVPTYYANSPSGLRAHPVTGAPGAIDTGTAMRKFVDPLPWLGAPRACTMWDGSTKLSGYLPVAVPDTTTYPGSDYYEIALVEYTQRMHSDLPKATTLRGYVQVETSVNAGSSKHIPLTYPGGATIMDGTGSPVLAVDNPTYFGPVIIAARNQPVRVKFTNYLPIGATGDLFIPVDQTLMGAGTAPDGTYYTQNRGVIHLHGGNTPWVSDGTPHQWTVPVGEGDTNYLVGDSFANAPDMPNPGQGSCTLFWTNAQSARLMFYHDHAVGITRLNVYAGEAAGYLIKDGPGVGENLPAFAAVLPTEQIFLVIQDKTFVPKDVNYLDGGVTPMGQDELWDQVNWGQYGDLWLPHVYEVNQDPTSLDGTNPVGRWDWGPWFWPVFPSL